MYSITDEGWSDEDERRFERVKQSELDRGMSEDLAEEIARRTVDLQRRAERHARRPPRPVRPRVP